MLAFAARNLSSQSVMITQTVASRPRAPSDRASSHPTSKQMIYAASVFALGFLAGSTNVLAPQQTAPSVVMQSVRQRITTLNARRSLSLIHI